MANYDSKTRALLDKYPWEQVFPGLLDYTLNRVRQLTWCQRRSRTPPGGKEVHDIAAQAVEKVFSGVRRWDADKHPDLFKFLCDVVDSDVNHLAESWENRNVVADSLLSRESEDGEQTSPVQQCEDKLLKKPGDLLDEKWSEERFWEFYEHLKDAPDLQRMLDQAFEGVTKRADLAQALDVPESKIDNKRKRLQRRYLAYYREEAKGATASGGRK
jgi:hypothetical protein